jgi:death-on-curing protein
MPFRNIEWWLEEDDVYAVIDSLSKNFPEDEIHIIDKGPLEFVANLRGLSHFYGGSLLDIASVIMRSVIQDHPLQDGNKRLGMILGNIFLENNNWTITASDEDYFEMALALATSEADRNSLFRWLKLNIEYKE